MLCDIMHAFKSRLYVHKYTHIHVYMYMCASMLYHICNIRIILAKKTCSGRLQRDAFKDI